MKKKKFNTTGVCYPEDHYMMDNSKKLEYVFSLIEGGAYFTINRPRQYGKTTTISALKNQLDNSAIYLPIKISFELASEQTTHEDLAKLFMNQMIKAIKRPYPKLGDFLKTALAEVVDMESLSEVITDFIHEAKKKVVLMIDEVDGSSNYHPFLAFLAMLRYKYLDRKSPENYTFHSVVLAGVHDVKSLKYKLRNSEEAKYNSPWNIAADFEVEMSFNPQEIAPMLEEYSRLEGVTMDIPSIAERLYYHTSGYPFLVSKLCKNIAEKILPLKNTVNEWVLEDVDTSVQLLLKEENTNFDSLINNLRNHKDLYDLVFRLLIDGDIVSFNSYNPTINKGILYGIFRRNGSLKVHNKIYEQLIYNALTSDLEIKLEANEYNHRHQFDLPNNELNFKKVLMKFQQFLKEQHNDKDLNFLEREWRLLFMAFIQPVLNGIGYAFKEPQISEEKRLDLVITYQEHRYIVELKKWYGKVYHERGLNQLADYLEIHGLQKGYLLIFDNRKKKSSEAKWISHKGKEIFAVWV